MKISSGVHIYLQYVFLDRSLIEKMEIVENLIEVGSQLSSVPEFYEFTEDIHKMIGCKDPEYDISKFFTPVEDIIYDSDRDYDCKRNFFMTQALKFPNVSNTMSQLKN